MRRFVLLVAALLVSSSVLAADLKFLDGPAGALATDSEKKEWKSVKTDADAAKFEELFWARRDPTPGDAKNEYRDDFRMKVAAAEKRADIGGVMGDRATVFYVLGLAPSALTMSLQEYEASKMGRDAVPGSRLSGDGAGGDEEPPLLTNFRKGQVVVWVYDRAHLPKDFPDADLNVAFVTEEGQGKNQLRRTPKVMKALDLARKAAQKSPDLKEVPDWTVAKAELAKPAGSPAPAAAPAYAVVVAATPLLEPLEAAASTAFTTDPAVGAARAFSYSSKTGAGVAFTSFLLVTKAPAVPGGGKLFGQVRTEAGNVVAKFAMAISAEDANGEPGYGVSLPLPAGKYKVALGLAAADGTSVLASAPVLSFAVPDLAADWSVSDVILSKSTTPLTTGVADDFPFVFGNVRIHPAGLAPFTPQDSLWFFYTVTNPTLDPATGLPKLETAVAIKEEGSKTPRLRTPLTETAVVKIGEGRFAIGNEIPLGQLSFLYNGTWRFDVDVKDTLAEKRILRVGSDFVLAGGAEPPVEKKAAPKPAPKKKGK